MCKIEFTKLAEESLLKISKGQPKIASRIAAAIDRLAEDPMIGVSLRGELKGLNRYRIGSYRIIYQVYRRQLLIIVLDIGHRREVYR